MTTPGLLSTEGLFFLVKGAIKAVSDRPGLTPEQKQTLVEQAWNVIVAYGPIDAQRAMLIGQSLVLSRASLFLSHQPIEKTRINT